MHKSKKEIRHLLKLNATQLDAVRGHWRNKTMVKAPMITFDGDDPHNQADIMNYHYFVMKNYTKKEPSSSQPRDVLQRYAQKMPHKLIPMQGFVIDVDYRNQQNPRILLAQPKIIDMYFKNRTYLVDTHMWLPLNRIVLLDDETSIQPTVYKSHILDIHQGDLLVFSAGIAPYQTHGKTKYGFSIINASGCGLPVTNHDSAIPYRLLDDYDVTSHLVSMVNLPTETEFYRIKDPAQRSQLYTKTYLHFSTRKVTHYWQFFEK